MIAKREEVEEKRLKQWSGIMREHKESGKSKKAYCETKGIHPNVFYYWQRKLREMEKQELVQSQKVEALDETIPTGWTACKVVKPPKPTPKAIHVEIGNYRVRVTKGADQELLREVCQTLVGLC